ncbi:MAG TPA: metal ABC transporter substrate-binding protein [Gemmatimonadaceae bacterium]|nr:metal ABC transporter substrate-binding protein [Gemmatimonadaceae bacterium]
MTHMIRRRAALALAVAALGFARPAAAQLKVVTSTTDLYDIARQVGGNLVTVTHIGEGYQDPHFIEAKPSFVLQLRNADVWAFVGLDLEIGWMPLLLDGARNPKVRQGGSGYLDVSKAIPVMDVPQGNVDRSMGDVHPLGNPHYWLDPENGRRIARLFKDRFSRLDRKNEDRYEANERAFEARLNAAEKSWAPYLAQIKGKPIIAYHTSWRYFANYTGMRIVAYMEPKPGVPPSPSHVFEVIRDAKAAGAKLVLQEPFYDQKMSNLVAKNLKGSVLVLPPSVGGTKGADDYISLMTRDIQSLAAALR